MSLKAFHILFVIASTLLTAGFGFWEIRRFQAGEASAGDLALGIGSLVLSILLIGYGKYILRKLKDISYL